MCLVASGKGRKWVHSNKTSSSSKKMAAINGERHL
jgi:hypothetical protein